MFVELEQLLAVRSLTITVAAVGGGQIRVNVVPNSRGEDRKTNEKISYSHKDEVVSIPETAIAALTTPISITGSPAEIDANLSKTLTQFVDSHTRLQQSFDKASGEIADAVKAIDERNKAKKEKDKAKKEDKNKSESIAKKPDDSLPLWWTDPSKAPGATPQLPLTGTENDSSPTPETQTQEITHES